MELADLIFLMERYGDNDAKCSSFLFGFGGVMWDPCLVRRSLVSYVNLHGLLCLVSSYLEDILLIIVDFFLKK